MKSNFSRIRKLSQAAGIVPQQRVPVDPNTTTLAKAILESPDCDRILRWLAAQKHSDTIRP